jgi:hypothetical protein
MKTESLYFVSRGEENLHPETPGDARIPCFCYVMASDYITKVIELGDMGEVDARDYIEFRLTRYLPDSRDNIIFEFLGHHENRQDSRAILITRKTVLAEYRAVYPKAKLVSLYSGFSEPALSFLRICIHGNWIEWAECNEGIWSISHRDERARGSPPDLDSILASSTVPDKPLQILCDQDELLAIQKSLAASQKEHGASLAILPFSEALIRDERGLFSTKEKSNQKRLRSISIAVCAIGILLFNLGVFHVRQEYDSANARYAQELSHLQQVRLEHQKLEAQLNELKKSSLLSESATYLSPYETLSALASVPGSHLRIDSFSYAKGKFMIEADATTALEYTAKLNSIHGVKNLKLSDVQPKNGVDHFFLTGETYD